MQNFTEDSIRETLRGIISEELKIEPEDIADGSDIANDIGVDSADMINILFGIESHFGVEISNEEASKNLTVQKMAALLKEKLEMKSANKTS
jgi:acyl carrier protein